MIELKYLYYILTYRPVIGILILLITFVLSKFIPQAANGLFKNYSQVRMLFQGTFRTVLWIIGILVSLTFFGVDVSSIVTSLGLIGFGIGVALKDMVSNLISGVMIMLYSPFSKGDKITIKEYKGTIRWVDLRYTTLHKVEGMDEEDVVLIPNATLFVEVITVQNKAREIAKALSTRPDGEQL